ncbi:FlaA1/EpsC-like NDP-sugar epimerase [Bradyrhizobium sp. USDA 4529]
MEPFNARSMLDAAASATAAQPQIERRRRLSPAALAVTNQKVRGAYSPVVIAGVVRLADFVLLSLVGVGLYLAYVRPLAGGSIHWGYIASILGMSAAAVVCFQAADIYQVQIFRGQLRQMTRMISSWAVVFLLFIGISFLVKLGGEVSRVWLSSFFCVGLAVLIAERLLLRSMVRAWAHDGRLDRRTIIVGADHNGEQLIEALNAEDDSDIHLLGVFDDRNDDRATNTCAGAPKLGKIDDIVEFARRTRVDLVLFALPISAETRILEMLKKLWVLPVDIRLSAHTNKLRFHPRSYSYIGKVPTLDMFEAPITDWDLVLKWLFDRVVGGLALVAGAAGVGTGGARGETRQPRPGAVPPEALRLQQ